MHYIKGANIDAMNDLGYPNYLEWIADCSDYASIKRYVLMLKNGVVSTKTSRSANQRLGAINYLEQFVDELLLNNESWPQFSNDKNLRSVIKYKDGVDKSVHVAGLCIDLKKEYIKLVGFAKLIFGKLFDQKVYSYIPVILNPGRPFTYYEASEEYLEKLSRRREERQGLTEEEYKILNSKAITSPLWGMFYDGAEPKIEIFYCNIKANTREDYLAKIRNCIAHEYMHYLHYCYCSAIGKYDTYKNENIREGIAEFFAMLFTLYSNNDSDLRFAEKRYLGWVKMFNSGWPYASALCMYKANGKWNHYTDQVFDFSDNGCIEKLLNVLKSSTNLATAIINFES
jgi:hypothetical protein